MHELNIITESTKLIAILKDVEPLPGFAHNFNGDSGTRIIITAKLQNEPDPSAKYILCSREAHKLEAETLSVLYDLWPMPLTRPLAVFLFRNIQERIRHELEDDKRIIEMARQDYLTGLATRWYLQDFIERNRHERNITCIYLDLDNFKSINDTFGHQAGDRALAATAEMMQNEFADAFAARMGGDEFMLVLLGRRDINATAERVTCFMSRLLKYYSTTQTMRALSVSAGISQTRPDSDKTIDQIIHEADRALYEAKKSGKSQCKIYTPSMG
ncbi:MAG: GGDEF domain-containing protein [Synergistaceae bacterium]|nr:GGDEF domain-containing protein [Synergistaceae bacterium]